MYLYIHFIFSISEYAEKLYTIWVVIIVKRTKGFCSLDQIKHLSSQPPISYLHSLLGPASFASLYLSEAERLWVGSRAAGVFAGLISGRWQSLGGSRDKACRGWGMPSIKAAHGRANREPAEERWRVTEKVNASLSSDTGGTPWQWARRSMDCFCWQSLMLVLAPSWQTYTVEDLSDNQHIYICIYIFGQFCNVG